MNEIAPAAESGQELNQDREKSQFSKKPHKTKGISHLKNLQAIANTWVERGYYTTPNEALKALQECTGHV